MLSRHLTKTVSRVPSLLNVHKSAAPLVQLQQVHLQLRRYKGEAGETVERLSPEEEKLATIAKPKYDEIYTRHVRMPDLNEIPQASFDFHSAGAAVYPAPSKPEAEELALNIRRKRLVYRSKQRGWLEVDLLLGTWASENVSTLSAKDLDEFEAFVNLETVDIYNIITLRTPVPESMVTPTGDGVVERIQAWARGSPVCIYFT